MNGVTHAKIIGIDNEQASLWRVAKELIGLGLFGHKEILLYLSLLYLTIFSGSYQKTTHQFREELPTLTANTALIVASRLVR